MKSHSVKISNEMREAFLPHPHQFESGRLKTMKREEEEKII